MKRLRTDLLAIGALFYPVVCVGCGTRVEDSTQPLCPGCVRGLERAEVETLWMELSRLPGGSVEIDDVFALWVFDKGGVVQSLQHALKYGNRPRMGLGLGRLMGTGWAERRGVVDEVDVLVPVPLARLRLLQRGYNQSAWLAAGIAEHLGCAVLPTGLHRIRETRTQTRLSASERIENTDGAFAVRSSEDVDARTVMLIDDVLTTGATGLAAARALKEAGAARVILSTLAFARPA